MTNPALTQTLTWIIMAAAVVVTTILGATLSYLRSLRHPATPNTLSSRP